MSPRSMKVKIPVSALIEAAEAERVRIVKRHEKAVAKQARQWERWAEKAADALRRQLEAIEAGVLPETSAAWSSTSRSTIKIDVPMPAPGRLGPEPPTRQIDRDLAMLRATSDTDLSISTSDDFARYIQ